jgi:SanA protein
MRVRRIFLFALGTAVLAVGAVAGCNLWVRWESGSRVFDGVERIPARKVGLVLGTSKRGPRGHSNPYFVNRVDAAAALYREGKVSHLLVSGDNRSEHYNEPEDLRDALIERGVPSGDITLDYAGLRTLDSVVRAKKVFGLRKMTVISQDFHVRRALWIARRYGIDAIGFRAREVPRRWSAKTRLREVAARVKVVLDLYLLRTQPRHLGDRIEIAKR